MTSRKETHISNISLSREQRFVIVTWSGLSPVQSSRLPIIKINGLSLKPSAL